MEQTGADLKIGGLDNVVEVVSLIHACQSDDPAGLDASRDWRQPVGRRFEF